MKGTPTTCGYCQETGVDSEGDHFMKHNKGCYKRMSKRDKNGVTKYDGGESL